MSRSRPAAVSSSRAISVGLAQDVEALARHLADDPDAEARAGERLAPHHGRRQAELLADHADLVLEERAQRLDQLELQVVRQAADVVVGLDGRGAGAAAGLDDVGVERALDEVRRVAAPPASPRIRASAASKVRMNSRPMIFRFSSGSWMPSSAPRNCSQASTTSSESKTASKSRSYLLGLAQPHHPVVDVHAGEPVADGPLHDRGRDRRVDAAGQGTDRAAVADLARIRSTCSSTMLTIVQVGTAAGDVVQEVLEHQLAVLGVQHLGMPLHPGEPAVGVLERRDRGDPWWRRARRSPEARRSPSRRATSRPSGRPGGRRAGRRRGRP